MTDHETGPETLTEGKFDAAGEPPADKTGGTPGGPYGQPVREEARTPAERFGRALRAAREAARLSIRETARQCHRAHSTLIEYENGRRFPPREVAEEYERVCKGPRRELVKLWHKLEAAPVPSPVSPGKRLRDRWPLFVVVTGLVLAMGLALLAWKPWHSGSSEIVQPRITNAERHVCARTASVRDTPGGTELATLRTGEPFIIEGYSQNGYWVKGHALQAQDIRGFMLLQNLSRANGSCPETSKN